jgi:hypothetical protein
MRTYLKSVAKFSYLYSRRFISSIQAMEGIEAYEHVPWSPGQNSSSRFVMQKTNNVQSSDCFGRTQIMARGMIIRPGKRRGASVPASYACVHGIWNYMEQATGKASDARRRGALH